VTGRTFPSLLLLTGAALAVAAWIGGAGAWLLAVAGGAAVSGLLLGAPGGRKGSAAALLLVGAVAAGFVAEWDMHRFSAAWPERAERWEAVVQDHLSDELDALLLAAEAGAERIADEWDEGWAARAPLLPPGYLPEGIDAAAVFGSDGQVVAWEGMHQGPFPADARFGRDRYLYREGALFGYLYVTHPLPDRSGTVATAALLRAEMPPGLDGETADFASLFEARHGAGIQVTRADRAEGESVWDLRWEDRILFSVSLDPLSEADALATRWRRWGVGVALALFAAWWALLPAAAGAAAHLALMAGGLFGAILLLPLGALLGAPETFSPSGLLLGFPPGVTLGDLLFLAGAAVFVLGAVPAARLPRIPPWAAALGAGGAGAILLFVLAGAASRELLAGGEWGWVAFQAGASVLVGLVFTLALLLGRAEARRVRFGPLLAAMGVALLLGLGAALQVRTGPGLPPAAGLLWAIPLVLGALALPSDPRWSSGVLRLVLAMTFAATLTLPWAWSERVSARMAAAEERVERLGTRPDPFLEFLLLRAGEEAVELAAAGRDALELLYGAWVRSGLAREDVPVWLTVWSPDGTPGEELRIGVTEERPPLPPGLLAVALREREVRLSRHELHDVHYAAVAPLSRGAAVSLVVPPRRELGGRAPLGPLFSPARTEPDPFVLIPLLPGESPGPVDRIHWVRSRDGWQGELYVEYPDEVYHAHYLLELPGHLLVVARGTLLLLLGLTPVLVLWLGGRRLRGEGERGGAHLVPWLTSFRGRVTLALFGFFLVPSLVFGTLAYRTLSGAAVRTAETLALHAVEDAARWYAETDAAVDLLARRTGSDLLLYRAGELVSGSSEELMRLGLYQGWLPPDLHREMAIGEALTVMTTASLGGWDYVVAFRRVRGGDVLASPAPLQAGATALRQREIADLLGFTVVLGAGLSVLLSLLVGRALARPIQTLRVASERVGAGNMEVHIPEDRSDEFGSVFSAFNRMVDRLASTRKALVQSSRRTRAIVEEVATGVVALDRRGRVTLANPRAEELLGISLPRNHPLPAGRDDGDPLAYLSSWVEDYLRGGAGEAGTELQVDDRRLRVRARRVSRRGPPAGAVVSLEDVTDELRTERILAWGEMARQVAHEVKNPLTPIKLGVQHVRRAWDDRRPDFEEILERNVGAILREIERLDAIASGFSRYGAPSPAGTEPPEAVPVEEVVREILTLYQAGDGPVRFSARGLEGLPRASARPAELKEVLVNLLENARAALPGGGNVVVEAEALDGAIELHVADDGVGIPEELLPKIFDPHFSTTSGGSGLGLAIVRRLVESWGGRVWVESSPGRGTTVSVWMRAWRAPSGKGADATVGSA
jgi:two-component system, NtrC family, nitrogen regulation sensor histidine kinase NtrY